MLFLLGYLVASWEKYFMRVCKWILWSDNLYLVVPVLHMNICCCCHYCILEKSSNILCVIMMLRMHDFLNNNSRRVFSLSTMLNIFLACFCIQLIFAKKAYLLSPCVPKHPYDVLNYFKQTFDIKFFLKWF